LRAAQFWSKRLSQVLLEAMVPQQYDPLCIRWIEDPALAFWSSAGSSGMVEQPKSASEAANKRIFKVSSGACGFVHPIPAGFWLISGKEAVMVPLIACRRLLTPAA
jgi:hypothetical protein